MIHLFLLEELSINEIIIQNAFSFFNAIGLLSLAIGDGATPRLVLNKQVLERCKIASRDETL